MELTDLELSALEEYSAGAVRWQFAEKIQCSKFPNDAPPETMIVFGGTLIAKTVMDGESVWAIVSKRKGRFYYTAYADTLEVLLAGL